MWKAPYIWKSSTTLHESHSDRSALPCGSRCSSQSDRPLFAVKTAVSSESNVTRARVGGNRSNAELRSDVLPRHKIPIQTASPRLSFRRDNRFVLYASDAASYAPTTARKRAPTPSTSNARPATLFGKGACDLKAGTEPCDIPVVWCSQPAVYFGSTYREGLDGHSRRPVEGRLGK